MTTTTDRRAIFDMERGVVLPDPAGTVSGADVVYRERRHLHTTYFDTVDLRLLRRGLALVQVAEPNHDHDRWYLELPEGTGHAAYRRSEVSWPGSSAAVPEGAARLLAAVTRGRPLEKVLELVVLRKSTELRDREGRALVIVADEALSTTSGPSGDFRRVAIEVGTDDPAVAEPLFAALEEFGARPQAGGPLARQLLAERLVRTDHQDVGPVELGRASSLADLIGASLANGLARLLEHDVGVRLDDDPEFVHQARVAVRRMRSDLKTLDGLLDEKWVEATRDELKWLGRALGDVRDADVLAARQAEAEPGDEGHRALMSELAGCRQAALARLEQVLDSRRYLDLVGRLDAACHVPPWAAAGRPQDADVGQVARELMTKAWHSWQRSARRMEDEPADQDLHRLRIKTKRVRYAAELLAPVVGGRATKLARAASRLQEVLGEHQDAVMAAATMWEMAAPGPPLLAFAAGRSAGRELEQRRRLRQQWRGRFEKLGRRGRRHWPGP